MSFNNRTPSMTNMSLANPELPRITVTDCIREEPMPLVVWLNSCLTRVSASDLSEPDRRCAICQRTMCDFYPLLKMAYEQAQKRPVHPAQAAAAAPAQVTSKSLPTADPRARNKSAHPRNPPGTHEEPPFGAKPEHTCDAGFRSECEFPIKVWTTGCEHFVGHSCLEWWIIRGRTKCPSCRTVWFKRAKNRRQTLKEAFSWWTKSCLLGKDEVVVDIAAYKGTIGGSLPRCWMQTAQTGTNGDAVGGAKADA
ncbi:uncharacterized protein K460DRAFT_409691 [Cucurbitaria berberidis CBS 394.84]|uniref:Uncharacterized protein n=1 Tax=Cucurbitaria berberidis CBS 394.84 TaxID=1168544 RepID=A0A9P4GBN3_9PLEO|nr:uncharacterized protein K460DRAFT_409691 [Cucurbitaria berberidis CBS 394.84]KAF1842275.1 hypothetical protein K460DRAFT_409691 [Cucurbitaria berberidis CBS 394.84]